MIFLILDIYQQCGNNPYSAPLHSQIKCHIRQNILLQEELRGIYAYAENLASLTVSALLQAPQAPEARQYRSWNDALVNLMLRTCIHRLDGRICGSFSAVVRQKSLPCVSKAAAFFLDPRKNFSQIR